jgi:hypothetical protein
MEEIVEMGSKEAVEQKIKQAFNDMDELIEMSEKINKKIANLREFIKTYAGMLEHL